MAMKKKESVETQVITVNQDTVRLCLLGDTPLIINRLAEKARQQLLMPSLRMNSVDKMLKLKHNPHEEFRSSIHRMKEGPTLLCLPAVTFKLGLAAAALDLPGQKKAAIGRLTSVSEQFFPVWGLPKLFMAPVRNSDINHTPDIRTRAILDEWACEIEVKYVVPLMQQRNVINLVAAAGIYVGVGDGRSQKGTFNYGQYHIVSPDDRNFKRIIQIGRKQQEHAMLNPVCYDDETSELLGWFDNEIKKRADTKSGIVGKARRGKANGSAEEVAVQ